ncbi:MAG: flagellar biosynthesis anti-sigma factor FlgM [Gammaproteobacteria bacterium]|nr:flagellar biosynthesis anti-sigma factor FlgM [Gammaproteobacteria bacterium]
MSNDISGINTGRSQHTTDRQTNGVGRDGSKSDTRTTTSGTGSQDKVVLTDMAARLKSLEQKLAQQPEVDQSHVNRVRDAIHRGEYRVNPDRVADKMIGFEQDF